VRTLAKKGRHGGFMTLTIAVAGAAAILTAAPAQAAVTGAISQNSISYPTIDGDILSMRTFVQPGTGRDLLVFGGNFSQVRTTDGVYHAARNLAVIDAQSGAFVRGFTVNSTGYVRAMQLNPAGTVLYVAGDFTSVNGTSRARLAALDTTSWALTAFNPGSSARLYAIEVTSSVVFVGGNSGSVIARNPTSGARLWSMSVDCGVHALLKTNDGTGLFIGGLFDVAGGFAQHGLVKVSAGTGVVDTGFRVTYLVKNSGGCVGGHDGYDGENPVSMVMDNVTNRLIIGAAGIRNGFRAVNPSTGGLYWSDAPAGDGQAVAAVGNTDIVGHHQSGLHMPTGWTGGPKFIGQVTNDGRTLTSWNPRLDGYQGNADGGNNGVQALAYDPVSQRLFVGGGFLTQNGTARKGLAVFTVT